MSWTFLSSLSLVVKAIALLGGEATEFYWVSTQRSLTKAAAQGMVGIHGGRQMADIGFSSSCHCRNSFRRSMTSLFH